MMELPYFSPETAYAEPFFASKAAGKAVKLARNMFAGVHSIAVQGTADVYLISARNCVAIPVT